MQSRPMALLLAVAALAAWCGSWVTGSGVIPLVACRGFVLPSPSTWLATEPLASFAVNTAALTATAVVMALVNGRYNILRSFSVTFIGLFLLMNAATPTVTARFTGGSLMALTAMTGMWLMYSVYNDPKRGSRHIFVVFMLLTAGALTQYGFLVYLPVFMAGIGQMRAMRARTLTAAALGIITPIWLCWAMWPDGFPAFRLPQIDNPFAALTTVERIRFFATIGVTLFTGLALGSMNLMKIYSYNAKARALNGLLTVIGVITGIAALADWTNMAFYVPLLNVCVAFQSGHFFHISMKHRWGYVSMLALTAIYAGLWVWSMI